jgi:hypothetical protein
MIAHLVPFDDATPDVCIQRAEQRVAAPDERPANWSGPDSRDHLLSS